MNVSKAVAESPGMVRFWNVFQQRWCTYHCTEIARSEELLFSLPREERVKVVRMAREYGYECPHPLAEA